MEVHRLDGGKREAITNQSRAGIIFDPFQETVESEFILFYFILFYWEEEKKTHRIYQNPSVLLPVNT
jgi:hypothetical protein